MALLRLNNGVEVPAIGFGVFQSSPEDTIAAVESAIAQGYRLIDTAASYFNERQVGEGVRRSGIARDQVFIATRCGSATTATRPRCTPLKRAWAS
jgi:diketogulonate reductase-like aldo/keto reductase